MPYCCYSASPSPPPAVTSGVVFSVAVAVVLIVPFIPSISIGPNVCPASVDTLSTDSLDPVCGLVSAFSLP